MIHQGDCLDVLKSMKANSVDSVVTDPPAGISFMGKDWDGDKGGRDHWIAWMTEVMGECLRVLKPGGHAVVWAIPRTSHWTATALENAGFEVRDVITHLFGSGFPKSMDISKAIDKAAGAEREVVSTRKLTGKARVLKGGNFDGGYESKELTEQYDITAPATEEAKQWAGWGTALKPASEHWILVRKPLAERTVAANVLKWGTGAINVDASRIEAGAELAELNRPNKRPGAGASGFMTSTSREFTPAQGRFPANLVLSHDDECVYIQTRDAYACAPGCAVRELDRQSGFLHGAGNKGTRKAGKGKATGSLFGNDGGAPTKLYDRGGTASRFFYCAKPSRADKGADNTHPTVKSTRLMAYLIRMITPEGGLVLDPFTGSGTTGVAAVSEGFRFVGIEREREYARIAEKRIKAAAS